MELDNVGAMLDALQGIDEITAFTDRGILTEGQGIMKQRHVRAQIWRMGTVVGHDDPVIG